MATNGPIIGKLRTNARWIKPVAWALYPLVWLGILSPERAVAFAMRFVRVDVEGWGGD